MSKQPKQTSTLQRLLRALMQYRGQLLIALLVTLVQVALTVYQPILIGQAIDTMVGVQAVDFARLKEILFVLALVIAANTIVSWVMPWIYNRVTYEFIADLRQQATQRLQYVPLNFLDQQSTGDLVSRIIADGDQLSEGMLMIFNQFLLGLFTIVVMIVTMARLDWLMLLIVIGLTPLSLIVSRFIAKKSYQLFQAQTVARGDQTQIIEESIQQNDLLRLFNAYDLQYDKLTDVNDDYAEYSQGAIFYSSTINPTTRFINAIIYAIITGVGAMRIINGSFTVGALTTFLNYANQYTKPFNDISSVLAELQSALASAERLFELLDIPLEKETGYEQLTTEDVHGEVEFEAVDFRYVSDQPLITNLNLQAQPGQTVAIVGPTGAGKSTLINLLMRFYDVDQGQICLDGTPINDYTRSSLRRQFGMVLQETWIKTDTVHHNIAYGYPDATREEVIAAAKAAHVHPFIMQLADGYDTVIGPSGAALSQGQQQLISIARIFMKIPNLLILDEATSSIDTRTELMIQGAFDTLMKNKTSFIIAHRLSTIQNADLILVLQDGAIVEQGNHNQLMHRQGLYYDMQHARSIEID